MRLLLDSHILVSISKHELSHLPSKMQLVLADRATVPVVSVASLWELHIKYRLGKLDIGVAPENLPKLLTGADIALLPIVPDHVFADVGTEPRTKDPFDRLLLGVCAAEGLRLVTLDRVLAQHPLAWRDVPSG